MVRVQTMVHVQTMVRVQTMVHVDMKQVSFLTENFIPEESLKTPAPLPLVPEY